jgi:hypothetical protein
MGKRHIGIAGSELCCEHYGCSLLGTIAYRDDFLPIKATEIYGMTIILTELIFGEE